MYIYPPRPEHNFPSSDLDYYDNGTFLGQPKLNGTCGEIYVSPQALKAMNRHKDSLKRFKITNDELRNVFGNNDQLICGEYMNISKKDENGKLFNHKFVIFDQLVHDGVHLLGSTFEERWNLIRGLYPEIGETKYLYKVSDNIYMVKSYFNNLKQIWDEIVKVDMLEGLVLKQRNGKLKPGTRATNNVNTQLKCRKSTKNYGY